MLPSETIPATHSGTAPLVRGALPPTCGVLAAVLHSSAPGQSRDVLNVATRLAKAANVPLTVLPVSSDDEITSVVAAMKAGMLVIGRGDVLSRGKMLHALLNGTYAPHVYQASPLPVVSVARPETGRDPLETIVIATDLSPSSWDAAVTAVRAAPAEAKVHVVHVVSGDPTVARHRCETTRAALAAWSAPLAMLLPSRAMLAFAVLTGDPYTAVAGHLSTVQATCVAMGGHWPQHPPMVGAGRTLPERLLATWRGSIVIGPKT